MKTRKEVHLWAIGFGQMYSPRACWRIRLTSSSYSRAVAAETRRPPPRGRSSLTVLGVGRVLAPQIVDETRRHLEHCIEKDKNTSHRLQANRGGWSIRLTTAVTDKQNQRCDIAEVDGVRERKLNQAAHGGNRTA